MFVAWLSRRCQAYAVRTSSRSEPSRRNLIQATRRVIIDKGLQGVRVREIAANAGMSPGSVLYHYPQHEDLMLAVHQSAVDEYVEFREATQNGIDDPVLRLTSVVAAGVPPYAPHATIRLLYEMHGLARQNEAHAQLMTSLWEREHLLYTEIIASGVESGDFSTEHPIDDIASALLALEDGLALHLVSGNTALDADRTIELFVQHAADRLHCPRIADQDSYELARGADHGHERC